MFFCKSAEGGGVISDTKNYIADFLVSKRYILVVNFGKNVQKGREGGGSSSIVWTFFKKTSIFGALDVPKVGGQWVILRIMGGQSEVLGVKMYWG